MDKIILDENFFITKDAYQWILNEKIMLDQTKKLVKKESRITQSFHPTFQKALKKYLDSSMKKADSLITLYEIIEKIYQQIETIKTNYHHE
jgi:hypothetical protein